MKRINEFKIVKFIGLGFISVILLALFFHNCYSVNTGEVVIISTWGK